MFNPSPLAFTIVAASLTPSMLSLGLCLRRSRCLPMGMQYALLLFPSPQMGLTLFDAARSTYTAPIRDVDSRKVLASCMEMR
jgi:hypothetical protein